MPIETDFKYKVTTEQRTLLRANTGASQDLLGLLRGFIGERDQLSWKGSGFNMIWRPNFGNTSGDKVFFLELNLTDETLDFKDVSGETGIPNRGSLQSDIFLGGMTYLQTVNDSFDNGGLHIEPGLWVHVPKTENPDEPATIARMGSIPHGTTINLQGTAFSAQSPAFDAASITPFVIGDPGELVHFDEEILAIPSTSRTDLARVPGLTQEQLTNPNLFLSQALAGVTVKRTSVFQLTSQADANTVPDVGGGTANIAFLVGKGTPPTGGSNADVPTVTTTFWIEDCTDKDGNNFVQLQYTQLVLLNFDGLSWPHVTVGTLRPQ
ncbi:heme-binding protein [Rhizobium sp.]|uniref:heme-binding protein n=1 Tax=Rhizobium sp. TaxID=391 RepID=UPI000E9BC501|nr:hypothetical protein [Rhizobium sp.]